MSLASASLSPMGDDAEDGGDVGEPDEDPDDYEDPVTFNDYEGE